MFVHECLNLTRFCFSVSYALYSRKKSNDKKVKKKFKNSTYLPLQFCLEHVTLVLYTDAFPYYWIVLVTNMWNKYFWLMIAGSPPIYNRDGNFFKKWGRVHLSPKKREVGKTIEEWRLLKENNLCLVADLCVYKSKKHPRYIYKSNKFYYIPKIFETRF